jgi:NADPH:quinone reductase
MATIESPRLPTAPAVVREQADVPFGEIARQIADGKLDAAPARVFSFDEIREAHRVAEAGEAAGKLVVVMD